MLSHELYSHIMDLIYKAGVCVIVCVCGWVGAGVGVGVCACDAV